MRKEVGGTQPERLADAFADAVRKDIATGNKSFFTGEGAKLAFRMQMEGIHDPDDIDDAWDEAFQEAPPFRLRIVRSEEDE